MRLTGHQIGLLKEYMHDLVEQARQDEAATKAFGFSSKAYRPDQAISDLLAILDDRIESEGVQVGLPESFLHEMWTLCNEAQQDIHNQVWFETTVGEQGTSMSQIRERTYRALIAFIERPQEEGA